MTNHVAIAEAAVAAPIAQVWAALTDTEVLGSIMFGSTVETDWQVGSPIVYRGEVEGTPFEDRGVVIEVTEPTRLRVSHETPDDDDETHEVTYELEALGDTTHVKITQDRIASAEAAAESSQNWQTMLLALKRAVETPA
jgi:uncharacterized protein YndB with AHSA1/START domain